MEKTRVPYGEKYWFINSSLNVGAETELLNNDISDKRFEIGNYFHTREEAEHKVRKLRAVLKGADVIEMLSEEEIKRLYPVFVDNDEDAEFHEGMRVGISNTIDYFKDKIVK